MKKVNGKKTAAKYLLTFLAAIGLVVAVSSCSLDLFNGTSVAIGSVEVSGLPASFEGKNIEFMGNWAAGGTAMTAVANNPVVDGKVTLEFSPPTVQSSATINFKLREVGVWEWAVGDAVRNGGADVGNADVANPWTGPTTVRKLVGTVDGLTIEWAFE